jgi:Flp pilus assembly protein TadD
LNHAISQVYNGEVDEGLATLYEMHYNQENNRNVRRALAWALLMKGNLDQAEVHYRQLMDKPLAADYLNGGYCLWFKGQVKEAVQWFRNYISSVRKQKAKEIDGKLSAKPADRQLREDFHNDASLLNQYKINDADQQLMIDIVTGEAS